MAAPSPSAILNAAGTPTMANQHPPPAPPAPPQPPSTGAMVGGLVPGGVGGDGGGGLDAFGGLDFGAGLGDFDPSLFNGDASINFERDFAAWFDPENA